MKLYLIIIALSLCHLVKAQNTSKKFSFYLKSGIIFSSFEPNIVYARNSEENNRWNLELSVEESKIGIGISLRYITSDAFIKNPIFRPPVNRTSPFQKGDIAVREQKIEGFSILVSQKIGTLKIKHEFHASLGAMQRRGQIGYFLSSGGGEINLDRVKLDRVGVLFRLGHTYLINKHWFLNSNFEYARFRMTPKSLIDFNVLMGYKF